MARGDTSAKRDGGGYAAGTPGATLDETGAEGHIRLTGYDGDE